MILSTKIEAIRQSIQAQYCMCLCRSPPLSRQEIGAGTVEILSFPVGEVTQPDGQDQQRSSQCFGLSLKVGGLTHSNRA